MRRFEAEVANEVNWERNHRTILVKACTLKGAIQKVIRKKSHDEYLYQITTRVKGHALWQPVWDYFNKDVSGRFNLKIA
jgi:hypothetical protein